MEARGNTQLDNPAVKRYIINSRDVTDRERRRTELQEYETIVESLADAVCVPDEEGNTLYVVRNRLVARLSR